MQLARSALIVLTVLAACGARAGVARGQEPGGEEDRTEKLKQELHRIDTAPKPGDEVIALSDADLMVEAKSVGSLRKGGKWTVEQVQDSWLWVRSGDTRGWIDRRSVMSEKVLDWYQRLPNNTSVTLSEQTRAKFAGILFEIRKAGEGPAVIGDSDGSVYGIPGLGRFSNAAYGKVRIILEQVGNRNNRAAWIAFDPPEGASQQIPPPPGWTKGRSYGVVQPGQHVSIDTTSRQVFVNGHLRRPE
jgi:hypothetical protein